MSDDNNELNRLLAEMHNGVKHERKRHRLTFDCGADECEPIPAKERRLGNAVQWSTYDDITYIPTSHTRPKLKPGVYEIKSSSTVGIYFEKIPTSTKGLLRFPQTNIDKVVEEIQKFWNREALFLEYSLSYKRGLLMWGPAGCGKSCAIKMIINDLIEREGCVVRFTSPELFKAGIRLFRQVEPETPLVILMEDIDSILDVYNESEVLNILDGVESLEKIVYLATTNHPERLGARIINRPSRFDKRFKIDWPSFESRKIYLEFIIGAERVKSLGISLHRWAKDTEELSIAHLRELFIAVVIMGDDYEEAIDNLRSMKEVRISSADDDGHDVGFHAIQGTHKARLPGSLINS